MPTTINEAEQVVKILYKWTQVDALSCKHMFKEMFETVGLETKNYSVRQSILMMLKLFDPGYKIPAEDIRRLSVEWYQDKSLQTVRHRDYLGITEDEYIDFMDGTYPDSDNPPNSSVS
jgi:hypothetical protein